MSKQAVARQMKARQYVSAWTTYHDLHMRKETFLCTKLFSRRSNGSNESCLGQAAPCLCSVKAFFTLKDPCKSHVGVLLKGSQGQVRLLCRLWIGEDEAPRSLIQPLLRGIPKEPVLPSITCFHGSFHLAGSGICSKGWVRFSGSVQNLSNGAQLSRKAGGGAINRLHKDLIGVCVIHCLKPGTCQGSPLGLMLRSLFSAWQ